jgi:hypothetical protein
MLAAAWFLQACGSAALSRHADAAPGLPSTQASLEAEPSRGVMGEAAINAAPAAMVAEAVPMSAAGAPAPAPPPMPTPVAPTPVAPPTPDADQAVLAEARKMVDIEARLSLEVEDVARATESVRALVAKSGAQVVSENVAQQGGMARAELTLRVAATAAGDFLSALQGIGVVRTRQVIAKDIGKEFYDATIRLANLEAVRKRYEEILAQAKTVEEILRLEGELGRIRQQIEQLKGELRWMRDRAARATVYVSLFTQGQLPPPPIVKPQAKLHPGLRLSYLDDLRGDAGHQAYLGAGLSLGSTPSATLELQGFRRVGSGSAGLDGLFVTLNGRFYSEFLGNGNREFLNPYLGLRGGYARFLGHNEIIAGGAVGLEIFKRDWLIVDADLRGYALFASKVGGHMGLEPSLGASVAF